MAKEPRARRVTKSNAYRNLEAVTPGFVKTVVKRIYYAGRREYNRAAHARKGRFAEFGYRFRFDRSSPFRAVVGERTVTDAYNVWNASAGDIRVGGDCWFGLHNIIMGPLEIGERLSTGPHVQILGPRHAVLGYEQLEKKRRTVIGDDVWISAGCIIMFGVQIGNGAIISPGSVVSDDVPANTIYLQKPRHYLMPRFDTGLQRE
jgi:acetyltransferase-like isoleucine patch superfamily enzyme